MLQMWILFLLQLLGIWIKCMEGKMLMITVKLNFSRILKIQRIDPNNSSMNFD